MQMEAPSHLKAPRALPRTCLSCADPRAQAGRVWGAGRDVPEPGGLGRREPWELLSRLPFVALRLGPAWCPPAGSGLYLYSRWETPGSWALARRMSWPGCPHPGLR